MTPVFNTYFAELFRIYDGQKQLDIHGIPLGDVISSFGFIILLITLLVSIRGAKESARANALNALPIVQLSYDHSKDIIFVENIGNSMAAYVKVDSFYNFIADKQFKTYGLSKLEFAPVSMLKPGEKRALKCEIKGIDFALTKFTMFSRSQNSIRFAIILSDLSGKRHISRIQISKGTVEVILSPRPFNIRNFLRFCLWRSKEFRVMCWYFVIVSYRKFKDELSSKSED